MEAYEKMLSLSGVPDEVGDHPGQGPGSRNQERWLKQWNSLRTESSVTTCCLRPRAPPRPVPRPGPPRQSGPARAWVAPRVSRVMLRWSPAASFLGPYPHLQTGPPGPRSRFGLIPAARIRMDRPAFSIQQSDRILIQYLLCTLHYADPAAGM